VREFITYTGLHDYVELRSIVRSHIIGWRKDMEKRALSAATIRRKLSAVSSLFDKPGGRSEAANGQRQRGQHAGARRPAGTETAGSSAD
jgi:hypothetical protein